MATSQTKRVLELIKRFNDGQKVYIEDFAPYVVITIPLMLKTFLHSYRVRLNEFRKTYNILALLIIGMLSLNIILTFINKPLYIFLPNPTKHFVYQYHFAKELAKELKNEKIDGLIGDDELILRLRFYGINSGESYYTDFLKEEFSEYPLWIANYNFWRNDLESDWQFWQFTEKAQIEGIEGMVDVNIFNGNKNKLLLKCIR